MQATVGELILDRYKVLAVRGRGVFSTVVFCRDTKPAPCRDGTMPPGVVAIKLIRNNDTMRRTATKEIELLMVRQPPVHVRVVRTFDSPPRVIGRGQTLANADKHNKHHMVRMFNSFEFRNHTCMVFEALHMDLNEVSSTSCTCARGTARHARLTGAALSCLLRA